MKIDEEFIKRRWFDFRQGHSTYLIFVMAFVQFVVVTYTLAIERFPTLEQVFPSMWIWATVFVASYIPAAIIIGHLHRKFQMPTETRQSIIVNPYTYYVTPGKEKLFNLPMNAAGLKATLTGMELQNQMADAIEKLAKMQNMDINIKKYSAEQLAEYKYWLYVNDQLQEGGNIHDVIENANRLYPVYKSDRLPQEAESK